MSTTNKWHGATVDADETDPVGLATEGFRAMLEKLCAHERGPFNAEIIGSRAAAALWHTSPAFFGGASQKEMARRLGITPMRFSQLVGWWANHVGYASASMRPRSGRGRNFVQAGTLPGRRTAGGGKKLPVRFFRSG
jgi:hypothetical protein